MTNELLTKESITGKELHGSLKGAGERVALLLPPLLPPMLLLPLPPSPPLLMLMLGPNIAARERSCTSPRRGQMGIAGGQAGSRWLAKTPQPAP